MLHTIEIYFLLFISYAFLGWCMEVTCKLIQYKKFINRGFLIGPYCPIYGWGALAITILLKRYMEDPLVLFVMSTLICSIIEYLTSYFMEKKYHARWWDYSNKKFNINGRICLETLVPFGILGVAIMYGTNPILFKLYNQIPQLAINILTAILFIGFIVDNIISSNIISSINIEGNKLIKDNTEEITEKIKQVLRQKSWLHRRLINAYPGLKDIRVKIKKVEQKIDEKRKKKNRMIAEITRKIGVFDSGIGGATVLTELIKVLPNEDYIYYSDSRNNPYGDKTQKEIIEICDNIVQFFMQKNCKVIVIACNTASAEAVTYLRKKYKTIPFIAIEPAYKMVYDYAYDEATLVMATKGTIESEKFNLLYKKYNNHKTKLLPCIGLADVIEDGNKEKQKEVLEKILGQYRGKIKNVVLRLYTLSIDNTRN